MDDDLIEDRVAMNLLYVQANSDIDRGWVNADTEQHRRLAALQKKNSKKEVGYYLLFILSSTIGIVTCIILCKS